MTRPEDEERRQRMRAARVRVTAPAGAGSNPVASSPESSAEAFYVRQLIRSQLRLAISVASGLLVVLLGIALLLAFWPEASDITLLAVPLPWWVLGIGIYPLICVAGALFSRSAARNERRYRSIAK